MKDNVICTNCEWKGQIEMGEETCPNCGGTGYLAWNDELSQDTTED